MVIVSAVICDKNGTLLISRQFQPLSVNELKEQVRNFPKLISPTQQHTFIDHEHLRFIYTPVDTLYILLITTKNSNIIEDLEVIRILKSVTNDICVAITEENIKKNSFEILLAIDDIISAGLRESVSTAQVQTALEMESSEEKLHMMLQKARENEAKELAKKHQLEVERRRQEELAKKQNKSKVPIPDAFTMPQSEFIDAPVTSKSDNTSQITQQFTSATSVLTKQNAAPRKGMQLGKKKDSQFEQE